MASNLILVVWGGCWHREQRQQVDGLGGPVDGLVRCVHEFYYFLFFYLIYGGRHLNRLSKSLIYCDPFIRGGCKNHLGECLLPAMVKFFFVVV